MNRLFSKTAIAVALCCQWGVASAAVIVGGEAGGVFPNDLATFPDAGDQNIVLGRKVIVNGFAFEPTGVVTVDSTGPNTTVSTDKGVFIGAIDETQGEFNVRGNGTEDSARLNAQYVAVGGHTREFGFFSPGSGQGTLNIEDGGTVVVKNPDVFSPFFWGVGIGGASSPGFRPVTDRNGTDTVDGTVNVTGQGSFLGVDYLSLGNAQTGLSGRLNISNGGVASVYTEKDFGFGDGPEPAGHMGVAENSTVVVDGVGSLLQANGLAVGFGSLERDGALLPNNSANQAGRMLIKDGASVDVNALLIGEGANGEVILEGDFISGGSRLNVARLPPHASSFAELAIGGSNAVLDPVTDEFVFATGHGALSIGLLSTVAVDGDVRVGGQSNPNLPPIGSAVEPPSTGILEVKDFGQLIAENVFVNQNGILKGGDGSVTANVIVDGGTVAPGNSPGPMSITGDFILDSGILELEDFGNGLMDQLVVGGDIVIGDDVIIQLILGFIPPVEVLLDDFFSAAGNFSVSAGFDPLQNILVSFVDSVDLSGGADFDVRFGAESFAVMVDPVDPNGSVPVPAPLALFALGLVSMGYLRRCM